MYGGNSGGIGRSLYDIISLLVLITVDLYMAECPTASVYLAGIHVN